VGFAAVFLSCYGLAQLLRKSGHRPDESQ
jgi:hypothetical protein